MNRQLADKVCSEARGLAIDAVSAAKSGHLGLPLGATEVGYVLYGHKLRFNPSEPKWINRDVFVLSAGHGSMFLYGWLHLSGFNLSLDDIKQFRQLHSKTPGHPEFHETEGVESTTGPLGQGVANAVGYAVSAKMAAAHFNTEQHKILTNKIVCLCGDGCLQEGVAHEAIAYAGHNKLDNLILIYDSNDVTLDAMAKETQSEDVEMRFKSFGFDVHVVTEGHNVDAIAEAYDRAHSSTSGKPQILVVKTLIAKGIPEVAGTQKGHGEAGVKWGNEARVALGLPADQKYFVSDDTRKFFQQRTAERVQDYEQWKQLYDAWGAANPQKKVLLEDTIALGKGKVDFEALLQKIPPFTGNPSIATRKAGGDVLQPIAAHLPLLVGGSADLYGSTMNYIEGSPDWSPANLTGRNFRFGIREHAMCSIMNGIAYHGIFRPSGATFLVFADYCRPAIRLAALSGLPVLYIFTHDSVGVGEDGPTHQPVETVSSLRLIPNLDVIRPADPEETAGAFAAGLARTEGPTLLSLTRQNLQFLTEADANTKRRGVLHGAYVLVKETTDLQLILLASGSEVQHVVNAAKKLGSGVRVVSVPSMEIFNRQSPEYRQSVLPIECKKRLAIEAGVTPLWREYVGDQGVTLGINRFGLSAPGATAFKVLGITEDAVVAAAQKLLQN